MAGFPALQLGSFNDEEEDFDFEDEDIDFEDESEPDYLSSEGEIDLSSDIEDELDLGTSPPVQEFKGLTLLGVGGSQPPLTITPQQPVYQQPQVIYQPLSAPLAPIQQFPLGPIAPGVVPNLPGGFQPAPIQTAIPAGTPISLNVPMTAFQQKAQAERTARQQINMPLGTMIAGQPGQSTINVPIQGSTFGPLNLNPGAMFAPPASSSGVISIPPAPIPTTKSRSKKTQTPSVPLPSQITGLPLLQPSSIPYDPTKQEPGESSAAYQRRIGLYQALLQNRLPNGQVLNPSQADVLSRMRNNIDIEGVGYNQAAMQIVNQFLPIAQ